MLLQRAATLSLRTGAVRTALPRLARPLCMHDDFKPKTKAYASESGDDVHAQAWQHLRTASLCAAATRLSCAHRSKRTSTSTRWWFS